MSPKIALTMLTIITKACSIPYDFSKLSGKGQHSLEVVDVAAAATAPGHWCEIMWANLQMEMIFKCPASLQDRWYNCGMQVIILVAFLWCYGIVLACKYAKNLIFLCDCFVEGMLWKKKTCLCDCAITRVKEQTDSMVKKKQGKDNLGNSTQKVTEKEKAS